MPLPSTKAALPCIVVLLLLPLTGHALTLEEGLRIVTEKGRDVAIARSDEEAAKSSVALARSPWLPQVDLYARETWLHYQPGVKLGPGGFPAYTSEDQFLTYGVRATQVLYDFGKTSSSIDAAKEGLKAREAGTFRTRNRSALEFLNAYFDLLESIELLKVARDEVTRYEAHRKDAESRRRAGVVTRNEELQAEVMLSDSKLKLVNAENALSVRESRVNSLLLRPLNDPVQPSEVFGSPALPATLDECWAAAERDNPDLRDLDARVRSKESSASSIGAEYLPTVYVSGGYEYSQNQYMLHEDNWTVIAGVNVNLFAGGSTSSRAGVARSEALSLKIARERALDNLRLDSKTAWLDVQSSHTKVAVAKAAVAQAEENLRLARLRYREGVGTSAEVTDAVALVTTAETNTWKAVFGLKRAEAGLLYITGRDLAAAYAGAH